MPEDGVTGVVRLSPTEGERVRGVAAGLGGTAEDLTRPELLDARLTGDVALVHSWEMVTAVDGPGTRMTLFLTGCPLRCQYCHNPDTMEMRTGTLERIEDVVERIRRYRRIFRVTRGGLTISGGEPLFQAAFTRRLLAQVHAAGIHTAIDTSGFLGARLSDEDLGNIDLVLLDVKSGDDATHREVTGQPLQPTLEFGDRLAALGKPVWVRFVLVPGLTDDPGNITRVADIVARWPNVERVEVLPFHNMGADKWRELGMRYNLEHTKPPTSRSLREARQVFRDRGIVTY